MGYGKQREERPSIVFMFSGQGSQYYGMGRELYNSDPIFHKWMNLCSRSAESRLGISTVAVLYGNRVNNHSPFDRTLHTHPSIFMLNFSVAQSLMARGIKPVILLGYSIGEAVTWALAGLLHWEEALEMVIESARIIEDRTVEAGMMALLTTPKIFDANPEVFRRTSLACFNYSENFVITGLQAELKAISRWLKERDILYHVLPISRGFHSPLLDPVQGEILALANRASFGASSGRVFSCTMARELKFREFDRNLLWEVNRKPVRFSESIVELERERPHVYVDAGPSGTLANLIKYLLGPDSASRSHSVLNAFGRDLENLARLEKALVE